MDKNKIKNLTDEQRKKLLTAAQIVEKGDFAVVSKIIEFEDQIDGNTEKIDGIEKKVEDTITEAKQTIETLKTEADSKLAVIKDGQIGMQGEKGIDGVQGKAGENGKDGRNGLDGKDGVDGQNGLPGVDGWHYA